MRPVEHADAVILGGGAAGLSLVCHLAESAWDGDLVVVDDASRPLDGRAWAWWSRGELLLDRIAESVLPTATVAGERWARRMPLEPYAYRTLTGPALGSAADEALARRGWRRLTGRAIALSGDDARAAVAVDLPGGGTADIAARWVLDGVGPGEPPRPADAGPRLELDGVTIETEADAFDPDAVTLMDFRTDQADGLAFMYVLPSSARRALVERVRFVVPGGEAADEAPVDAAQALDAYLGDVLGLGDHRIVPRERGSIPLDAHPAARAAGAVVPVGARAGMVKASTGYGFARIQRHSAALAAALAAGTDPGRALPASAWARVLDGALLRVIRDDPAGAQEVLAALLLRHPVDRVLRFLDEEASAAEQLRIVASLPEFARSRLRAWAAPVARW
ncbi:lycopene cyclase family protein [Demequina soli]|uniref:lycopene cyclase family protein n=1 Tax=Demequina soli TaxID=1638987 RepID=UPI0007842B96|nr:lycopene cyclase family protein [Demequina soli]